MRAVLSLFLVTTLAAMSVLAQAETAVSTDQPSNSSMIVAPSFESAEFVRTPEPASAAELLLAPGAVPAATSEFPTAPQPAPPSTVGWVAIGAGALVVLLVGAFFVSIALGVEWVD
jgi:hypothetical protein